MNSFRPEIHLLLDCARTCLDAQGASRIKSLISEDIDWTYLSRIARGHRMMPLLYRTLNSTCSDAVPKEILQELREHFYANAGRNLFLTKELIKIVEFFEAHGIPSIPYKGPVLAASVYGNLAFREFGDLDILVRERDYPRAQRLLVDLGFRLTIEHEWENEFVDESGKVAVDLHQRIAPQDFPSQLTFDYLCKRLQPVVLPGGTTSTLCSEHTLLMLSIQVTKDGNLQLSKICDIAELLRVDHHLNWAQVLKETHRLGGQRMLLYALRLARDLIGTALPQEIASETLFHPSLNGLVAHARRQLFHLDDSVYEPRPADCLRWVLQERLRDKLRAYHGFLHDVVVPCEPDRKLLPLPRELSFLYYFIRPVRLLGKRGLRRIERIVTRPTNHDCGNDETPVMPG
jgi:hypothetical protein